METRRCERCGTEFVPKREHARFCSARCRVAWNRENWNRINRGKQACRREAWEDDGSPNAPGTEASALGWAIVAMRDTTDQLGKVRAGDRGQAFAVIGEAVWWVTIVDATLIRYHPDEYEAALASLPAAHRRDTETTFTGLRFVRNRMGYYADHADFIQPRRDSDGVTDAPITEWSWRPLPPPMVATLPPRGQEWELSRYQAYQDRLAGRPVGETFSRASAFLDLVAQEANEGIAPAAAPAAPGGAVEGGRSAAGQ